VLRRVTLIRPADRYWPNGVTDRSRFWRECGRDAKCPLRATRWQLDANSRDMLDHARANLDQALSDCRELAAGELSGAATVTTAASRRVRSSSAIAPPLRVAFNADKHSMSSSCQTVLEYTCPRDFFRRTWSREFQEAK
jgi:hypothetical protein